MDTIVQRLIQPSPDEIDACVYIIDESFQHAFFLSALDNDETLVSPLIRAHVNAAVIDGEVWVAKLAQDDTIIAAALWFGPGAMFLKTEAQKNAGWHDVMCKLSTINAGWWGEMYEGFSRTVYGEDVKLDAYHLQTIGVRPAHHGEGIARKILNCVHEEAKQRAVPLVVETTLAHNVLIYERLEFRSVGSHSYTRADGSEGTIVALRRD